MFDNLEYISFEDQKTDFPKHFHDTFCISLIHRGVEQTNFETQTLFSEQGSISFTNPFEIHSNPLVDNNSQLKFDTIYLSNDVMRYFLKGKDLLFLNMNVNNPKLNKLFQKLTAAIDSNNEDFVHKILHDFIHVIETIGTYKTDIYSQKEFKEFKEVDDFILANIEAKFSLDKLSKIANINKYSFIKKFKATIGMTPMNYVLMKKIFEAKSLIHSNTELTQLAYQYNFSDIAHFSKTFKHYVGVSPKCYQSKFRK